MKCDLWISLLSWLLCLSEAEADVESLLLMSNNTPHRLSPHEKQIRGAVCEGHEMVRLHCICQVYLLFDLWQPVEHLDAALLQSGLPGRRDPPLL